MEGKEGWVYGFIIILSIPIVYLISYLLRGWELVVGVSSGENEK